MGKGKGRTASSPNRRREALPSEPATPSTSWVVVIVNRSVVVARLTPASPPSMSRPSMSRPSIPRRPSPWRCGAHGSSAHSGCKGEVSPAITCCGPDSQPWGEGVAAIGEDGGGADGAGPTAIPLFCVGAVAREDARAAPACQRAVRQSAPTRAVVTLSSRARASSCPWKEERAPLPRGSVAVLLPLAPALLLLVVGGEGGGGAGHQVGAADGLKAQQLAPCPFVLRQWCGTGPLPPPRSIGPGPP